MSLLKCSECDVNEKEVTKITAYVNRHYGNINDRNMATVYKLRSIP